MTSPFGRPREFKFKMREELVGHVAHGESVARAAEIIGVSLRTVQREAKHNQQFHHDLELAKLSAPRDLEHQMKEAARTHWRAAAWLLERQDPDRFGKRPANSCSPAMLQDACDFLIERALEATPAEHREAVYRHMTVAADEMYAVIMPDRSVERRCLASALSQQTTPLSYAAEDKLREDPDYVREVERQTLAQEPWRQVERLLGAKRREERGDDAAKRSPASWQPAYGRRQDSAKLDAPWHYPTEEQIDAYYDKLDERRGLAKERVDQRERDRERVVAELDRRQREKQAREAALRSDGKTPANTRPANAGPGDATPAGATAAASSPVYGPEFSDCVIEENCEASGEGLMSPKTCFRDKSPATKVTCAVSPETHGMTEPDNAHAAHQAAPGNWLERFLAQRNNGKAA